MLKLTQILAAVGVLAALSTTVSAQPAVRGMAACRLDIATFCQGIEAGRGKRVTCLIQNQDKLSPDCKAAVQQRAVQAPVGGSPPAPGAAPTPAAAGAAPPVATAPAATAPASPPAQPATTLPSIPQPPLKSATPANGGKSGGRFAACRADMQALCANTSAGPQAGGGGRIRCLQDNQAKLSPACAETLAQLKGQRQDARFACASDANRLCPGLKGEPRRACFSANHDQLSPECAAVVGKRASAGGAQKQ